MPLDSYLYTAVIEACTWQLSLEFLAEMERNSIEPSEVTYSVVIKACGVGGQWQKALELLDEMRRKKMPINLYVYNAAITAVAKAAKQQAKLSSNRGDEDKSGNGGKLWIEVMTLLDNMRKDGIEPGTCGNQSPVMNGFGSHFWLTASRYFVPHTPTAHVLCFLIRFSRFF